ncbi:IDEAL domain-containing protein [Paenibacillus sp. P26]|nr:IDEAL domain-containing protein [Paenibacillus sp. P26]UUZ92223.1 IDEAL domain-containing protein [Paenibacillus sp. P25]
MNLDNRTAPEVGDWVSGTSLMDERFIGYVEQIDQNGLVKIHVTQCDHESAVGNSVKAWFTHIERLPESAPSEYEALRGLMDLALMTRDREWFQELASKLADSRMKAMAHAGMQAASGISGLNRRFPRRVNLDF